MAIDLRPFRAFNRYVHDEPGDPDVVDLRPYRLVNVFAFPVLPQVVFNVIGSPSFDPVFATSSGVVNWDFGDGSPKVDSNSPTHIYADTNVYNVTFLLDPLENITSVTMNADGLSGEIDLSELTNLSYIDLQQNSALTSVINPVSPFTFSHYRLNQCNLTGVLDMSGINALSVRIYSNPNMTGFILKAGTTMAQIRAYSCNLTGVIDLSEAEDSSVFDLNTNPNLTGITTPTTTKAISFFQFHSCNLTGNLDLSSMTGMGGTIDLYSNPNLTSVTFPTSATLGTKIKIYSCDLTGTLDISGMTGLFSSFNVYSNPNLTNIINPPTTIAINTYNAYSCDLGYIDFTVILANWSNISINLNNNGMTATEVNHILVDLDVKGWINGTLNIAGTNSAPDGTSGGFDGLTAKTNLITDGWTVTTN